MVGVLGLKRNLGYDGFRVLFFSVFRQDFAATMPVMFLVLSFASLLQTFLFCLVLSY
jgi:hypothetical protein